MAWREQTEASRILGEIVRRHHELVRPELSIEAAAAEAGVSASVYDNIEKGRLVSLPSYRKVAKGLRIPGGIPRFEAIFDGDPDPGPGPAVSFPEAFHPAASEDVAVAGRTRELLVRLLDLVGDQERQIADLADKIESLAGRLDALEGPPPTPKSRRKSG